MRRSDGLDVTMSTNGDSSLLRVESAPQITSVGEAPSCLFILNESSGRGKQGVRGNLGLSRFRIGNLPSFAIHFLNRLRGKLTSSDISRPSNGAPFDG